MDAVAELVAEHLVHELVLRDPAEPGECRRAHDRLEVMPVAVDDRSGARDPGLDSLLELLRRDWHPLKRSGCRTNAILNEAMITLTDRGAEKVREFLATQETVASTAGLRVGVRGGGCSGFQY